MTSDTPPLPEIPDKTYFKIGEVAEIVGVKPYILRYWESEFRYISPKKTRSRHRMYRKKDIEILLQVRSLLYDKMFTIPGARKRLKEMVQDGTLEIFVEEGEDPPVMGDDALEGTERAALEQEIQQLNAKIEQVISERDEAEEAARMATGALKEVQAAHDSTMSQLDALRTKTDLHDGERDRREVLMLNKRIEDLEHALANAQLQVASTPPSTSSVQSAGQLGRASRETLERMRGELLALVDLADSF